MRPTTRRIVLAVLAAAPVSGCADPGITDEASATLEELVGATWDAAEAGEVDVAEGQLGELRDRAQQLHDEGEFDEDRLGEVLAAADAVADQLAVLEEAEPEPQEPADDAEADADDEDEDEGDGEDAAEAEDRKREGEKEEKEDAEEGDAEKEEDAQKQERKRQEEAEKEERKRAEKDDDD